MKSPKAEEKKVAGTLQENVAKDKWSTELAIGTISLSITLILLIAVNYLISQVYHPDTTAALKKIVDMCIYDISQFAPEPTERMQYQVTLLCMPVFSIMVYTFVNRLRSTIDARPAIPLYINLAGILVFVIYFAKMLAAPIMSPESNLGPNSVYFGPTMSGMFLAPSLLIYTFLAYLLLKYQTLELTVMKQRIISVICWLVVAFFMFDLLRYNFFNLAFQRWATSMETNAIFYSVTQVYAGKSLLVDFNAQYGLYAWILNPLFHIIGLSTTSFTMTMAVLNVACYVLIYMGLRKLVKRDVFALFIFLALIFWQYWYPRMPFDDVATVRYYYQYCPLRVIFPAATFYLVTLFATGSAGARRILLPLLSLVAAMGILWNMDSGLVAYGATFAALLVFALNASSSKKEIIAIALKHSAWMIGALIFFFALFAISTKLHSGQWPAVAKMTAYQNIFYISGYYMLPMMPLHFWNLPGMVYLCGILYVIYRLTRNKQSDTSAIAFLVVLGMGLFAYFQGRSYFFSLNPVIYPAIIIGGIFCDRIFSNIGRSKFKFHEQMLFCLVPFFFIANSALSMLYYTPSIHAVSKENAALEDEKKEGPLREKIAFIKKHLAPKDTAIILCRDYESYYYAVGGYYDPVNAPSTTELFFKTDFYKLLDMIRTARYPVVYDPRYQCYKSDSLLTVLSQNAQIVDNTPDLRIAFLKPAPHTEGKLPVDAHTVYHDCLGGLRKYTTGVKVIIPETLTIELIVKLDSAAMKKNAVIVLNKSEKQKFRGMVVQQDGPENDQFAFTYGNGTTWVSTPPFRLSYHGENYIKVHVDNDQIVISNNGVQCVSVKSGGPVKNGDGIFIVDPTFSIDVKEIKISNQ